MKPLISFFLLFAIISACNPKQKLTDEEVLEKGTAISGKLLTALLNELNTEIKENGIVSAINYCSFQAIPITKQISEDENVQLSRVSHRNRNPINAANEEELKLIEEYIRLKQSGEVLKPVVVHGKGTKTFYSPILLATPLCLSCHGKPEEMNQEVRQAIAERYPDDKAINFELNEVRGMFKVVFSE